MQIAVPIDSYVDSALPSDNYGAKSFVALNGTTKYGVMFFRQPFPLDAVVSSADLNLTLYGSWAGTTTLTAQRLTTAWTETTVNWNNKPTTTATNAGSVTIVGGTSGQGVSIDLQPMMADVAAGGTYYGVQLSVGTAANRYLLSSNNPNESLRPTADFEWSIISEAPTNLTPSAGNAVGTAKPYLSWEWGYGDNSDDVVQQAYSQVDLSGDAGFSSVQWTSGTVANTLAAYDLSTSSYPGTTVGGTVFWRTRVWDDVGNVTPYSDGAEYTYQTIGTVGLAYPWTNGTVDSTTPPITFTLSSGTQEAAEVIITQAGSATLDETDDVLPTDPNEEPAPADEDTTGEVYSGTTTNPAEGDPTIDQPPPLEVWRYPKTITTGTAFNVPEDILQSGYTYNVTVNSWDTVTREGIANDPGYATASRDFVYARPVSGPAPIWDLTLTDYGPAVRLDWTAGTAPDYFSLRVDGREVRQRMLPGDVRTSGTSYQLYWWNSTPRIRHRYVIEAVTLAGPGHNTHSRGNKRRYKVTRPQGIWLVDPSKNLAVMIRGLDAPDMSIREVGNTYDIVGSSTPVRILDSLGGYEGSVSGFVKGHAGRDAFIELKDRSQKRQLRLIFSDMNLPIRLEEVTVTPDPETPPQDRYYDISFSFFQCAEYPWTVQR